MCQYIDELKRCGFKKKCIKEIAKKFNLTQNELKKYFSSNPLTETAAVTADGPGIG